MDKLTEKSGSAMSVNIGLTFAQHMQLLPIFLQPAFLIILLGNPLQARAATYGFVAEKPDQITGDRPESKRTPYCVRLLSPDLLHDVEDSVSPTSWHLDYNAVEVQTASIIQAVDADMCLIRDAVNTGSWQPLLQNGTTEKK